MPKLGGVLQVYNENDYLAPCLKQSLGYYDEIVAFEGCHSKHHPTRSTDGTIETLEDSGIDYHMVENRRGERYDAYQASVISLGIAELQRRGCDWFRIVDVDMFFFDKDLKKIKETMESTEKDCILFNERRFIFNWIVNAHGITGYFYRMIPNLFLTPISRVHYPSGEIIRDTSTEQLDICCHHYTSAKKLDRMKFRYAISKEKGTPGIDEAWEAYKRHSVNELAGIDEMVGGIGANFLPADHAHPEVLDGHEYRFCNDIRKKL